MSDPLQKAYEQFLLDGDSSRFQDAIGRHGGRAPDSSLEHPVAHRICDVDLQGTAYRIVRVADPDDQTTRLFIFATENPRFDRPGVPLALRGEALWHWVHDEMEHPSEEPTDWSQYDPSLAKKGS